MSGSNNDKIEQELRTFKDNINVHDLPEIFHYWSHKFLRPMVEECGFSNPDELFSKHLYNSAICCDLDVPIFLSIGAGNCDTEVRVALQLQGMGLHDFTIECLELNPHMLHRGQELAIQEGLSGHLRFVQADFNDWRAERGYAGIMANQALHHVCDLEGLLSEVKCSLNSQGSFVVSDIIGKNGHQKWPEALDAMTEYWRRLPMSYKYNHQLRRYEDEYVNWDCSAGGFEGIRAQDILPLLVERFHFELFIGFANVVDVFIDRGFGHNFSIHNSWDTGLIDEIHNFDELSIANGTIKPTHMMASMRSAPVSEPKYSRGYSPEYCIRDTSIPHSLVTSTRL